MMRHKQMGNLRQCPITDNAKTEPSFCVPTAGLQEAALMRTFVAQQLTPASCSQSCASIRSREPQPHRVAPEPAQDSCNKRTVRLLKKAYGSIRKDH